MLLDRRLLRQLNKAPWLFLLAVTAGLLSGALVIAQAWQISRVITGVFLDGFSVQHLVPALRVLLLVILARPLAQTLAERAAAGLAARMKTDLRGRLLQRQVGGELWLERERSGELSEVITGGVDALDAYFSQYLPQVVLAALVPLAMLAAVLPRDLVSGLILAATAPLIPLFMVLLGQAAQRRTRRQFSALGHMSAYLLDVIQGITTLKMLGYTRQAERVRQVSERYRDVTVEVLRWTFLSALALELIATISTAVLAVQIGLRLLSGSLTFQPALFVLLLAPEFYQPLRQLGLRFHAAMSGVAAAERIFALLHADLPAVHEGTTAPKKDSLPERFDLSFEGVSFRYPGRDTDALEDIHLTVRHGEITAVIGESGSGKSTLLQLLLGLIQPGQGVITVSGRPLGEFSPEDWRASLAWVPQAPTLFPGTLAENIALSRPDAGPADILAAARWAGLQGVLDRHPGGLMARIEEGGAGLSGGEMQRLALARAWLRGAPLWLLDEPSAFSDPFYEEWFAGRLASLRGRHTLIVLAHHLSSALLADQVVVLCGGRVVEKGRPADLSIQEGKFRQMLMAAWL